MTQTAHTSTCSCPGVRLQSVPELVTDAGGQHLLKVSTGEPSAQPGGTAAGRGGEAKEYQGVQEG